jgi:hypothetical protein
MWYHQIWRGVPIGVSTRNGLSSQVTIFMQWKKVTKLLLSMLGQYSLAKAQYTTAHVVHIITRHLHDFCQ